VELVSVVAYGEVSNARFVIRHSQKVENEILEQESHLRLREVATMKKMHLTAARTIDKLKDDVSKEDQEWKEHTIKTIEDLRHDNQHLHKLHELTQVNLPTCTLHCEAFLVN
jgi:hypothetical protein